MSGRHGGRASEAAGARDFTPEPLIRTALRTMGRRGGRVNEPAMAQDEEPEWITVRYGVWQGLVIGKTYTFEGGRKGKVLEKRENAGLHTRSGLPRVRVEWKD